MSQSIDPAFGHWLAGFIDGEGSFTMQSFHGGVDPRPRFSIEVRADDTPIIEEIHRRTGIGKLSRRHRKMATIKDRPQIIWTVNRNADLRRLVEILDAYPLRAKKKRDYEIWKQAVPLLERRPGRPNARDQTASIRLNRRFREIQQQLIAVRKYREPDEPPPPPPVVNDGYEEVPLFEM